MFTVMIAVQLYHTFLSSRLALPHVAQRKRGGVGLAAKIPCSHVASCMGNAAECNPSYQSIRQFVLHLVYVAANPELNVPAV